MDEELRRAFDEVKASQRESTAEVRGQLAGLSSALGRHSEESAARWAEVNQRAKSAHERIDEHIENHRSWASSNVATWVAIATSLLAVGVSIAIAVFSKKG